MKLQTRIFVLALIAGLAGAILVPQGIAQRGYGRHHDRWRHEYDRDRQWDYCPYCGSRSQHRQGYYGESPGYDRHYDSPGEGGYGMGPGMMEPGYGRMGPEYYRPYDAPDDRRYRGYREPLERQQAGRLVEDMLRRSRNPHLKVGDIEDSGQYFVVEILTKSGSLADKIQVDKNTGMMRSGY